MSIEPYSPIASAVYYAGSRCLVKPKQMLRPARHVLPALRLANKPIPLNDIKKVQKYLQGSKLLYFQHSPNHRYKANDELAPTLLDEQKWSRIDHSGHFQSKFQKHFRIARHASEAKGAVISNIVTAAMAAQDWLREQCKTKYATKSSYIRTFKNTKIPFPNRCAVYQNVKISPSPITLEYDLDTLKIPTFEGKLDFGFSLMKHDKSIKDVVKIPPSASNPMLAGVMMCDSVEELVEKDWKWKATASALYQKLQNVHDPRGGRSFTLAVTDGHAWRFYLATRHCVQSMEEETDKIRIEQTENLLYQEEDRWRIIEILADMMLFEKSPYFNYLTENSDDFHEYLFGKGEEVEEEEYEDYYILDEDR